VPSEAAGERLDVYLAAALPHLSRSFLKRRILEGRVLRNGQTARPSDRLADGDRIEAETDEPDIRHRAEADPSPSLAILYEDAQVVVIDKPAGQVVHPAIGHGAGTVVNGLLARYPEMTAAFGDDRPGIVHRLDRDTSGVLVAARTPLAAEDLLRQFKARTVEKVYLALARGDVQPRHGLIDAPVGRDRVHRQRMAAVAGGRSSQTTYRVLGTGSGYSWLELHPHTGRTHQIRVHLAAVGHPVAGDPVYGRRDPEIGRMALHAWKLTIDHPGTGERMTFVAPVPGDLARAVERLIGERPAV
jgi:23S rRNA pseudouridine1911/1915/1917 synthase